MKKILFFLRVLCLVRVQAKCRRASPTRPETGQAAEPNQRGGAPDYRLPAQLSQGERDGACPWGAGGLKADSTPALAGCVGLTGKQPADPGQRPQNTWKRKALAFGEVLLIQTGGARVSERQGLEGEPLGGRPRGETGALTPSSVSG